MRFFISLLILFCCQAATVTASDDRSLEKFAARAAAEYFLLLLDQEKYDQCWQEASNLFREAAVKLQWQERIGHLRSQYGELTGRQLRFDKFLKDVEGVPDGDYFFMIYGTSFTNRDSVIETVTVMKEPGGRWRVSGYSIK